MYLSCLDELIFFLFETHYSFLVGFSCWGKTNEKYISIEKINALIYNEQISWWFLSLRGCVHLIKPASLDFPTLHYGTDKENIVPMTNSVEMIERSHHISK